MPPAFQYASRGILPSKSKVILKISEPFLKQACLKVQEQQKSPLS